MSGAGLEQTDRQPPSYFREDAHLGDEVIDANGVRWSVLNRPDGSQVCDGLFLATDGRQQYAENMAQPLLHVRDFASAGELAQYLPTDEARGRYWNERIDHYFDSQDSS